MESGDLGAVLDLSIAAWQPIFDSFAAILGSPLFDYLHPLDWRTYQPASVRRTCEDDEIDAFVVVADDGAVVGYVALGYDSEQRMGVVQQIAVHPDHQRHGYARALMKFATEQFRDKQPACGRAATPGTAQRAPCTRVRASRLCPSSPTTRR